MMLAGLRSRWTTPRAWAKSTARHTWEKAARSLRREKRWRTAGSPVGRAEGSPESSWVSASESVRASSIGRRGGGAMPRAYRAGALGSELPELPGAHLERLLGAGQLAPHPRHVDHGADGRGHREHRQR